MKLVGERTELCGNCPRGQYENSPQNPLLETLVATLPVRDALDWQDELQFLDPVMYEEDLAKKAEALGISTEHMKQLIVCGINRAINSCKGERS